ncbi:MAG: histone deacetylase [Candidatus Aminicenantes bacterium]|nr:histone deacetylase [Candidatus Aminicenantes bacterium]
MPNILSFLLPLGRQRLSYVYSPEYWMWPTAKHVFPVKKYRMVYERLASRGARREDFLKPRPATEKDLLLVHTPKYLRKLKTGGLSHAEATALELPFSPDLVRFAFLSVGGTVIAAEQALRCGLAVHLGGGFHHAFPDHGEGFCLLNDVAVSCLKLKVERKIQKAMIVDCDLHQGNGTASIFSRQGFVFTFSIHQMDVYPAEKPPSTVDVGLWSGDGDEEYLSAMNAYFPRLYREFAPDIVFYLAGADPFVGDQLGGLKVTREGLRERDRIVIENARRLGIPLTVVLAGGYAADVEDVVAIHLNTISVAQKTLRRFRILPSRPPASHS